MHGSQINEELVHELNYQNELDAEISEQKNRRNVQTPRRQATIPVQREYEIKFSQKIDEINKILSPNFEKITKEEVFNELRDKIYVSVKRNVSRFIDCNKKAMDLHANYQCSESLLKDFETIDIPLAKSLAREY